MPPRRYERKNGADASLSAQECTKEKNLNTKETTITKEIIKKQKTQKYKRLLKSS
jgi:hypothetical protein